MTDKTNTSDPLVQELSEIVTHVDLIWFASSFNTAEPSVYPFDVPILCDDTHLGSPKDYPAVTLKYSTESKKHVTLGVREKPPFETTAIGYYEQKGKIIPLSNQQVVEITKRPDFIEKVKKIATKKDEETREYAKRTGETPTEELPDYYTNYQETYAERFFKGTEAFANNLYKVTSCGVKTCNSKDGQELFVDATQCYGCGQDIAVTAIQDAKGNAKTSIKTNDDYETPFSEIALLGSAVILDDPDNKDPNNFIVPNILRIAQEAFKQQKTQ